MDDLGLEAVPRSGEGEDDPFRWDDLLVLIEQGDVVPVVGRELNVLATPGGEVSLHEEVARRIIEPLRANTARGGPASAWRVSALDKLAERAAAGNVPDINEVAIAYLSGRRDSDIETGRVHMFRAIYSVVQDLFYPAGFPGERPLPVEGSVLRDPGYSVPAPLRKLAAITDFPLYVSTTCDPLLQDAIDLERFGGERRTRTGAYGSKEWDDIPGKLDELQQPWVYRLFGSISSGTDYALTDVDALEFLHRLQSRPRRPSALFSELKNKSILFLGCGLPDGLARIVFRTVANEPLQTRKKTYKFADSQTHDPNLALFLRQCESEVFIPGNPPGFVDQLHARWLERRGGRGAGATRPEPVDLAPGTIFLSYKSEDRGMVETLRGYLEEQELEVFMDARDLEAGQVWESVLRRKIKTCALFVPCISSNAFRADSFLNVEWNQARNVKQRKGRDVPFILPVILDDTDAADDRLWPEFKEVQAIGCPQGEIDDRGVSQIRRRLEEVQAVGAGGGR